MLLSLLLLSHTADAAGYRYLRLDLESSYGVESAAPVEAGFGLSFYSDGNRLAFLFGDDAGRGGKLRRWGLEGRRMGPVIGVIPADFSDIEEEVTGGWDWLVDWKRYRYGGDADERIYFTGDYARSAILNGLALFGVEP